MSASFNEQRFKQQVNKAITSVQRILETTRTPRYAEDEEHTYDDKFGLSEFLTKMAFAAQINVLERMGMDKEKLEKLRDCVQKERQPVTLRFVADESCRFIKEATVDIESQRQKTTQVNESSASLFGGTTTKEYTYQQKVITKIKEFHWNVQVRYHIFCFAGSKPDKDPIMLQSRTSSMVLITTGSQVEPLPPRTLRRPIDVSLTWLMQNLEGTQVKFKIDRTQATCRTPRRNDETEKTMRFCRAINAWSRKCVDYFVRDIERDILGKHRPTRPQPTAPGTLLSIQANQVFVPVLPLMEGGVERKGEAVKLSSIVSVEGVSNDKEVLLDVTDMNRFLNEQCRSLDAERVNLSKSFLDANLERNVVSGAEAHLVMFWWHLPAIGDFWLSGVNYVEHMLRNQVVAAIGREISSEDFDEFMSHHNQKIFGPEFSPKPFCYAVRRPDHYPDGMLSIEYDNMDRMEPIQTIVRAIPGNTAPAVDMPINAATTVKMTGDRFLHGWIQHRFSSSARRDVRLAARARQFSGFMLLIGNLAGCNRFKPKDAIIIKNKDEVLIPLILNDLPTAKQFNRAITSLSPEQQRFAQTYRNMQLESSVVGVCVVQLKPQLEVLLGLPDDSLTKEIRLTNDLLTLFLDYQIPSDLLSYDGLSDAALQDKLDRVKKHVKAVMDVIEETKAKQLEEQAKKAAMSVMAMAADTSSPPKVMSAMPEDSTTEELEEMELSGLVAGSAVATMYDGSEGDGQEFEEEDELKEEELGEEPELIVGHVASGDGGDFTALPSKLNSLFEKHEDSDSIRTTTIKTGEFRRKRQEDLLSVMKLKFLSRDEQKTERNKAFDLLDALSRSGALPMGSSELHVILALTHAFEETIMGTIVERNENPIEKVEKSTLLVAATVHGTDVPTLVAASPNSARLVDQYKELEL